MIGMVLSAASLAAEVSVLPVVIHLGPTQQRHAVSITNHGDEPLVMQAEAVVWTQTDQEDVYDKTAELVVNPPIFQVKPGNSQVLRIGLRSKPSADTEKAYRLILREVPSQIVAQPSATFPPNAAGSAVRVLLQMRLPVYVAPLKVRQGMEWKVVRRADGEVAIEGFNTGNVRVVVSELRILAAKASSAETPLVKHSTSTPVFPGRRRSWTLRPDATSLSGPAYVEVDTDRGAYRAPIGPQTVQ